MSDVSYTEERAEQMLFGSVPMGTQDYYIYVSPENTEITMNDYSSFNGKKIGVNAGSYQETLFIEWSESHGLETEVVELNGSKDSLLQKLTSGEIDALVTLNVYADPNLTVPLYKIGSSNFYFVVNNNRGDLLGELDSAMNRIQGDDSYYVQKLYDQFFSSLGSNIFLNDSEKSWLSQHDSIKVGYMADYLPFCAEDEETGELTGALKEYLRHASGVLRDTDLKFDPVAFHTIKEALDALLSGDVNCVFPANFGESDAEDMNLVITPSIMSAELYEIVRTDAKDNFGSRLKVKAAVDEGNTNYEKILSEKFPDYEKVYYPDIKSCLDAVAKGEADTVLVSNFRYNNLTKQCEKLGLTPISTGLGMENAFALKSGETELYSIINKTISMVPSSKTNSVMTKYISEKEEKLTTTEFLMQHLTEVLGVVVAVLMLILLLVIHILMNKKKARKSEKLIAAAETDHLTGVYSKNFLFEYARRMQEKRRKKPMDAIVLDIERFHSINALNGQEFGDTVLSTLAEQIKAVFNESDTIVGRIEADHFCVFCWHQNNYKQLLDKLQGKVDEMLPKVKVRLRMGVLPEQTKMEPEEMYVRARIACNMSRGQYTKEPLVVYDDSVRDNRLDHSALKLEVTESAYTENADRVIRIIEGLRKKGFEIELDDFGTGYSSLGMLSSMPIDVLKMDRSFIVNMHNSETAVQLVKLILDLAKEMKIPVIAEGVEDKIELQMLRKMGCDIVQGYYFSKPLPVDGFEDLLNKELDIRFNTARA